MISTIEFLLIHIFPLFQIVIQTVILLTSETEALRNFELFSLKKFHCLSGGYKYSDNIYSSSARVWKF
ncbi:hypothetical protein ASG31_04500 [Chryseobacterium sp. Leaf404]|nr:hypothetical protein ASG31_04500 [Chryseobacterium sp. Leaf404]